MTAGRRRRNRLVIRLPPMVRPIRIPTLSRQVCRSIERWRPAGIACDASALRTADMAAVDLLARVHLAAARAGVPMVVTRAPAELYELVELAGLSGVLNLTPAEARRGSGVDG